MTDLDFILLEEEEGAACFWAAETQVSRLDVTDRTGQVTGAQRE